jgi:hypothetical protein
MYTYSSIDLTDYNCGTDVDCDQTVDDLSAAWNTLLVASSVSALLCMVGWLLSAPRNFYPCLYNTKVYQTGVREEKKVLMWFVKPIGLTYLLTILYIVVFFVQFIAFFKYVNQLPSNEDLYDLSLHYLNSDPTLCSVANPCAFAYESVYTFNRNTTFLLISVVYAGLAVVFVAAAHRLKLQSTRWGCFSGCYTRAREGMSSRYQSNNRPPLVVTEEAERRGELAGHSVGGGGRQTVTVTVTGVPLPPPPSASSAPPEAVLIASSEVQMQIETVKWTEVDLNSKC